MPKGGKGMDSPIGVYSYKNNPLKNAKMTMPRTGPALGSPANSDQVKVGQLRSKAFAERDSLRGTNSI
jgi:hypothetical protein